jgi:glycosyl transferase family 25
MEFIEKIIYINLDRRTDRREEIENEFKRMHIPESKVIRFPAIEHEDPNVGCLLSHASVAKLALKMGFENVLILEDDFNFQDHVFESLDYFFQKKKKDEWDVLLLSQIIKESEPIDEKFGICLDASNAAGYLMNKNVLEEYYTLLMENVDPLFKTKMHWLYVNDVVWSKLMKKSKRWFCFYEKLGYQRYSYSDLGKKFVKNG